MIRLLLISILASVSVAASAQTGGFQPLSMQSAMGTPFGPYSLRLADPDNAAKPTMWQGPLTITGGGASCTAAVSLVTAVYAAPGGSFVIVLTSSGSNAIAHFIDLASCAEKWPAVKRAASDVKVAGNRLSFLPACEGGGGDEPSQCSSAGVYLIHDDEPPSYLRSASYKLTAKELGVGFTGEARVMNARTRRAIIVH